MDPCSKLTVLLAIAYMAYTDLLVARVMLASAGQAGPLSSWSKMISNPVDSFAKSFAGGQQAGGAGGAGGGGGGAKVAIQDQSSADEIEAQLFLRELLSTAKSKLESGQSQLGSQSGLSQHCSDFGTNLDSCLNGLSQSLGGANLDSLVYAPPSGSDEGSSSSYTDSVPYQSGPQQLLDTCSALNQTILSYFDCMSSVMDSTGGGLLEAVGKPLLPLSGYMYQLAQSVETLVQQQSSSKLSFTSLIPSNTGEILRTCKDQLKPELNSPQSNVLDELMSTYKSIDSKMANVISGANGYLGLSS